MSAEVSAVCEDPGNMSTVINIVTLYVIRLVAIEGVPAHAKSVELSSDRSEGVVADWPAPIAAFE